MIESMSKKHADDTRDRILAVSKSLFWKQGYEGTTTRQISEAAGISTGLLFFHFKNKDELFSLALGDVFDSHFAVVREYIADYQDHYLRCALARIISTRSFANPRVFRMFSAALRSPLTWKAPYERLIRFNEEIFRGSPAMHIALDPINNLARYGAERALLLEIKEGNTELTFEKASIVLTRIALGLLRLSPERIDELIEQALRITHERPPDFSRFDQEEYPAP